MDIETSAPSTKDAPVRVRKPQFRNQILAAIIICLGPVSMGNVVGYSSPAVPDMNHRKYPLDDQESSLFGSLVTIGALFGGLMAGPLVDYLGRKFCIMLTCVPNVVGWLLIVYSNQVSTSHLSFLYMGRIVTGICAGISSLSAPVYISEIASPEIRGTLGSGFQLFVNFGIFIAYMVGTYVPWTYLALVCSLVPIFLMLLIIPMPESPVWLIRNQRRDEALNALLWLRGVDSNIEGECFEIEENLRKDTGIRFTDILRPELLKPLLLMLAQMFLQQFCGVNAVVFNTATILQSASPSIEANSAAMIVAAVMVIASVIALYTADCAGRRIMLVVSAFWMSLSLMIFGGYYYIQERDASQAAHLNWIPVLCLVVFVFAFNLGLGPIPWLMMSEVFPSHARGVASSITTAFNWLLAFIVTKTFVNMQTSLKSYGVFWFYGIITALGIPFVWFVVPETKGKTLEEIRHMFTSRQTLLGEQTDI